MLPRRRFPGAFSPSAPPAVTASQAHHGPDEPDQFVGGSRSRLGDRDGAVAAEVPQRRGLVAEGEMGAHEQPHGALPQRIRPAHRLARDG